MQALLPELARPSRVALRIRQVAQEEEAPRDAGGFPELAGKRQTLLQGDLPLAEVPPLYEQHADIAEDLELPFSIVEGLEQCQTFLKERLNIIRSTEKTCKDPKPIKRIGPQS